MVGFLFADPYAPSPEIEKSGSRSKALSSEREREERRGEAGYKREAAYHAAMQHARRRMLSPDKCGEGAVRFQFVTETRPETCGGGFHIVSPTSSSVDNVPRNSALVRITAGKLLSCRV
nr:hypothetical protein CFP56_31696 [Quercus suber]